MKDGNNKKVPDRMLFNQLEKTKKQQWMATMDLFKRLTLTCLLAILTACKIDLTIFGAGTVATDSGSLDCTTNYPVI